MKMHVEVECSPEEARAFLGLPDLRPMQQAMLARLEGQMLDALGGASPEALLRAWMPMLPANLTQYSPEQLREATLGMFRMFLPGAQAVGGSAAGGSAAGGGGGGGDAGGR